MKPMQIVTAALIAAAPLAAQAEGPLAAFDVAEDLSRFVYAGAPSSMTGYPPTAVLS